MEVTFDVLTNDDAILSESDLAQGSPDLRKLLDNLDQLEGLLTIDNPDAQDLVVFRDVLSLLISYFCMYSIPDLANGKPLEYSFAAYNEHATLKVDGDTIVVHYDGDAECRCPAAPLLAALVACGERFVALIKRVYGNEPSWSVRLAAWEEAVTRARNSL